MRPANRLFKIDQTPCPMEETPLDAPTTEQPKNKGSFGKVLIWNFGLMLGFMILTGLSGNQDSLILDLVFMVLQVILNLVLGLILLLRKQTHSGLGCLSSAFLVFIVGYGMCAGKVAILGG